MYKDTPEQIDIARKKRKYPEKKETKAYSQLNINIYLKDQMNCVSGGIHSSPGFTGNVMKFFKILSISLILSLESKFSPLTILKFAAEVKA